MSKLTQATAELDNSFADTAGNILKYFGKVLVRLGKHLTQCILYIFIHFLVIYVLFLSVKSAAANNSLEIYLYKNLNIISNNILLFFIFSDEKEKEEILKELRNIVIENCRTIGEIKAANEVKDELMCTDEESSEDRNVEKILEVNRVLS